MRTTIQLIFYLLNQCSTRISTEFLISYHYQFGLITVITFHYAIEVGEYIRISFEFYSRVSIEMYKIFYLLFSSQREWFNKKVSLQSIKNASPMI